MSNNIEGATVWVDRSSTMIMQETCAAWRGLNSLRIVGRRELSAVLIVQDAAQPGGQNQAVAHLRGCLVTTAE